MNQDITLIIPSFNRADLIPASIDSALAQTVPFAEIIVVDDGSTDGTLDVLRRYGSKITVLALSNGGPQRARNAGVHAARTPYIALCDSDDLLVPTFVATIHDFLKASPETDSVYTNFHTFCGDDVYPDKLSGAQGRFLAGAEVDGRFARNIPDLYLRTVDYQALFPTGTTIKRSFYQSIGGFSPLFFKTPSEDWEYTLRAIAYGKTAYCLQPLAYIRKHPGNQSADSIRQVAGTIKILEYALRYHPMPGHYRAPICRSINQRQLEVFDGAFAGGKFPLAKEMLGQLNARPKTLKFRIKQLLTVLPGCFQQPLWALTQQKPQIFWK